MNLCAGLTFCFLAPAGAQVVIHNKGVPLPQRANQKTVFERELAILITDMQQACDLSETQVRKLNLAAKGAVESAVNSKKNGAQKLRQQMQAAGLNLALPNNAEDGDEDADAADAEAKPVPLQPAMRAIAIQALVADGMHERGTGQPSAAKERLWTATVERVLSDEQREKYAAVVAARSEFARNAAVLQFIARVDQKLLLSDTQRDALFDIVNDQAGELLAKRRDSGIVRFFPAGNAAEPPIAHAELEPLLTTDQFTEWKLTFEPELQQLNGRGAAAGVFMGGNAIQIQVQ